MLSHANPPGFRCKSMLHWLHPPWKIPSFLTTRALCVIATCPKRNARTAVRSPWASGDFSWLLLRVKRSNFCPGPEVLIRIISYTYIYIYECRWQLDDNEHIVINMCSFGIRYSFKGVFQWHIFILSSPQSWRCISYIHPRLDKIGIDLQRIEPWPSKHRSVDRLWLSLVEFWSGHLKINQSGKLGNFPMTWGETCKLSLPKLIRFHGRQWFQLIPKRPTKFQLPKGWTNPGKLT